MVSRRQLLIALGASSLAAPFPAFAQQQGKVWRIKIPDIVTLRADGVIE